MLQLYYSQLIIIIIMFFLDIDECTLEVDTCDDNADCTDIDGSYICTCHVGFTGDGETCCTYVNT